MKGKTTLLLIAVVLAVLAGVGAYLFTIGPWGEPALAVVNGEKITAALFQAEVAKLDPASRPLAKEEPRSFLEVLINRTILLQEAKKEKIAPSAEAKAAVPKGEEDTALIMAYLEKKLSALPPIPKEEVEKVYEAYKDQTGGRNKEEVISALAVIMEQQRQGEEIQKIITDLRGRAKIEIREKELKKIAVVEPGMETQSEPELRQALSGGKPVVADFGSNTCLPCRELRPILQKVRTNYSGRLAVLVIDVRNNRKLAEEYGIQVIPTVIFFDSTGKEIFRHQGFMSEEQIKGQLKKMGVV